MNRIFADFLSPFVSKIHHSDPTVSSIDFSNQIEGINLSEGIYILIEQLSQGISIEVNDEQLIQLQHLSIILQNEELFTLLNDKREKSHLNDNLEESLKYLKIFSKFSELNHILSSTDLLKHVSNHFYELDKKELISLQRFIVHSIISSEFLVVESEDSLFEFIEEIFKDKKDEDKEDKISFYEELEITMLSANKFKEMIDQIEIEYMTKKLWTKLCECFYTNKKESSGNVNETRYVSKSKTKKICQIEFDGNSSHRFEGLIHYLTEKSGGNVSDNGTVNVTSSSTNRDRFPRNAVDFDNIQSHFCSAGESRDWLRYDFIGNKVIPTHYSIRTRHDDDHNHPRSWVIEGSNTGGESDSEWTILDSHENDSTLQGKSFSYTFDIKRKESNKEGYRYLRIRQTGNNSSRNHWTIISALEYFGTLIEE